MNAKCIEGNIVNRQKKNDHERNGDMIENLRIKKYRSNLDRVFSLKQSCNWKIISVLHIQTFSTEYVKASPS